MSAPAAAAARRRAPGPAPAPPALRAPATTTASGAAGEGLVMEHVRPLQRSLLEKHGYQAIEIIGRGGFGEAILVQSQSQSKKHLVCKMVDISQAPPREVEQAKQEGRLLAEFRHPFVVRMRQFFSGSGWFCIVMDFCEGGDLEKRIKSARQQSQRIPENLIVQWITQAFMALRCIHDRGVIHRDLKPSNMFLSASGNLKIGDFGLAKVLTCASTQNGSTHYAKTFCGTACYISPEVWQDRPYNWRSDIWAMGCILYELCARQVLFSNGHNVCHGPMPPFPAGYSGFLKRLCNDMLSRKPENRPSAATILELRPQIDAVKKQINQTLEPAQDDSLAWKPREAVPLQAMRAVPLQAMQAVPARAVPLQAIQAVPLQAMQAVPLQAMQAVPAPTPHWNVRIDLDLDKGCVIH